MKLLLITLMPLTRDLAGAPRPLQAIPDFRAAGHEVLVAAPVRGQATLIGEALGARALLPLLPAGARGWGRLILNSALVARWGRRWRPDIYLSTGARAATMAHGSRGATGGYGLSVLYLPRLRYEGERSLGRLLERRAIHECDRLVTPDADLARNLIAHHGARGGDLILLPGHESSPLVPLCERFLAEPPGLA